MPSDFDETRRHLVAGSVGLATSLYAEHSMAATEAGNPTLVDEGEVAGGKISSIYQSAKTRKPVSLPAVTRRDAFRGTLLGIRVGMGVNGEASADAGHDPFEKMRTGALRHPRQV